MSDEELTPPVEATEQVEQELAPSVESSANLAAGLDIGGAAADVDADDLVERPDPVIRGKIDKFGNAWGTGRRKTAVARVCLKDGNGKITVNKREFAEYFVIERDRELIERVLVATEMKGKVDIDIRVNGGGPTGQTGAVVLGVARALQAKNPGLHQMLHAGSFLTRDGRMVERKKYGFKKARRSFQFSKR
ncbi:MAG: 30S ribosomal protein S9 [Planctomycetaceae bacterium]|nr:30S ribosomal protein S9 [Planctomycetaceae bacterium]